MAGWIKNVPFAIIGKNVIFILIYNLNTDSIFRESIFTMCTIATSMEVYFVLIDP